MERYRTIRAYSAGGVVFRLVPLCPDERSLPPGQPELRSRSSPQRDSGEQWEARGGWLDEIVQGTTIEVALVGRSNLGLWALPKGTPERGETIEQVAVREVQEETGLQVRLISYVGSISYSFVRDQVRYYKQVRHFLFEAIGGDVALHDHEYDLVAWFPLPEAGRRLTYQNELHILYQAEDVLQRWLHHQQQEGLK